jgi:hypothetical protein
MLRLGDYTWVELVSADSKSWQVISERALCEGSNAISIQIMPTSQLIASHPARTYEE